MSQWTTHDIDAKVIDVLERVPARNDVHHFGLPYFSAYQLAIEFANRHPDTVAALDLPLGGAGTGQHTSLTQYLARELSRRIHTHQDSGEWYPVEGAFLSNRHARDLVFTDGSGQPVRSSLVDTDFDLSLFRLRAADS